MSKIDIISREWCDLVFEGRNKSYGAYELRSKAGKRHLLAIIDILIGIAILAGVIFTYTAAKDAIRESMSGEEEMVTELSQLKKEEPKKEEKKVEIPQEQPQQQVQKVAVKASIAFTVPDIVDQVDETKKIKNQEELSRSKVAIATQDYIGDSKDGINIDDLRENQEKGGTGVPEEEAKVFTIVEQMPSFPGGDAALLKYIASNIRYPSIAQEQDIQGQVLLRFVVLEDGRVGQVVVQKSLESHCDAEAIRVVKTLPRFIPGKQQGKPVRVWYTLPIRFVIQ
ncbi:energy transducer TonB [Alloprevotella sp. OH1205_COT-284]|uniref:energy transducer TonB n=1 Tax=Alloprevotella sp. OH1205_COT-284 TaxID=2491043 RepID=UPI000F5F947C|nr:energy transducer TonB [Alloprevotella sp. OH1205_COT-284]RRD78493.1 energy transducer TonB [Alloprevotella sp. OH1205_COT-284]